MKTKTACKRNKKAEHGWRKTSDGEPPPVADPSSVEPERSIACVHSAMDSSPNRSPNCSPNVKTLAIAAGLFTVITLAQFFAAVAANSTALLADCVSMVAEPQPATFLAVGRAESSWLRG